MFNKIFISIRDDTEIDTRIDTETDTEIDTGIIYDYW